MSGRHRDLKPQWLALPLDLLEDMERAGLDERAVVLNIAAWCYAARHRTDGLLTGKEVARLQGYGRTRLQGLLDHGFWKPHPRGVELVGYLDVNSSRATVEARLAGARDRQARYARSRSEPRGRADDEERDLADASDEASGDVAYLHSYPSPEEPERVLTAFEVQGGDGHAPRLAIVKSALTHATSMSQSDPVSSPSSVGRGKGDASRSKALSWDAPQWAEVRHSWESRGLALPPTQGQLRHLWPVVMEFGPRVAGWVASAPVGDTTFSIIEAVLEEAHRTRALRMYSELTEAEQAEWSEAEAQEAYFKVKPFTEARFTGLGLPNVADGENPYRVMLSHHPRRTRPSSRSVAG